jgi:hypothetical protein
MFNRLVVAFATANKKRILRIFFSVIFCFYAVELQKTHENFSLMAKVALYAVALGILVTGLVFWPIWLLVVRKEARAKAITFRQYVLSDAYDALLKNYSTDLNKKK